MIKRLRSQTPCPSVLPSPDPSSRPQLHEGGLAIVGGDGPSHSLTLLPAPLVFLLQRNLQSHTSPAQPRPLWLLAQPLGWSSAPHPRLPSLSAPAQERLEHTLQGRLRKRPWGGHQSREEVTCGNATVPMLFTDLFGFIFSFFKCVCSGVHPWLF